MQCFKESSNSSPSKSLSASNVRFLLLLSPFSGALNVITFPLRFTSLMVLDKNSFDLKIAPLSSTNVKTTSSSTTRIRFDLLVVPFFFLCCNTLSQNLIASFSVFNCTTNRRTKMSCSSPWCGTLLGGFNRSSSAAIRSRSSCSNRSCSNRSWSNLSCSARSSLSNFSCFNLSLSATMRSRSSLPNIIKMFLGCIFSIAICKGVLLVVPHVIDAVNTAGVVPSRVVVVGAALLNHGINN